LWHRRFEQQPEGNDEEEWGPVYMNTLARALTLAHLISDPNIIISLVTLSFEYLNVTKSLLAFGDSGV
jgi:hypothetical protein